MDHNALIISAKRDRRFLAAGESPICYVLDLQRVALHGRGLVRDFTKEFDAYQSDFKLVVVVAEVLHGRCQ